MLHIWSSQNMFLAIINDTYSEVKAEIAAKRNEFEIGDYFKVCSASLHFYANSI